MFYMNKTNAVRMLEAAGIKFRTAEYKVDENEQIVMEDIIEDLENKDGE